MKFFVIQLPDSGNLIEVVPENWLEDDQNVYVPPDFPNDDTIEEAPSPEHDWENFRFKTLRKTSKFTVACAIRKKMTEGKDKQAETARVKRPINRPKNYTPTEYDKSPKKQRRNHTVQPVCPRDIFANSDIDSETVLPDIPNKSPQKAKEDSDERESMEENVSSQQVRRSPRKLLSVNYGLNSGKTKSQSKCAKATTSKVTSPKKNIIPDGTRKPTQPIVKETSKESPKEVGTLAKMHKDAHERYKAINEKRSQRTDDETSNGIEESDESLSIHSDDNSANEVDRSTPEAASSFTDKKYNNKKKIEHALPPERIAEILLGLEFDMKKLKQDVAILKANKKKGKDNNDTESDDAEDMFEKQFPLANIADFDALETSISSSASERAWLKTVLVDAGGNGYEQWALNALKKVFDGGLRKTGLVLFGKRGTGATRRVLHNTHFFCVFKSAARSKFPKVDDKAIESRVGRVLTTSKPEKAKLSESAVESQE